MRTPNAMRNSAGALSLRLARGLGVHETRGMPLLIRKTGHWQPGTDRHLLSVEHPGNPRGETAMSKQTDPDSALDLAAGSALVCPWQTGKPPVGRLVALWLSELGDDSINFVTPGKLCRNGWFALFDGERRFTRLLIPVKAWADFPDFSSPNVTDEQRRGKDTA